MLLTYRMLEEIAKSEFSDIVKNSAHWWQISAT